MRQRTYRPVHLRHPDPWGPEVTDAIKQHAMDSYPKEACGLVIDDKYVPCDNIHPEPDKAFRIDPGFSGPLFIDGKIQAVIHSHPDGPNHPSMVDIEQQLEMDDIPWGVVSVTGDITEGTPMYCSDVIWWGDSLPDVPLIGRRFLWNVFTCYQLYRDWWWQERGIRFPTYPMVEDFIQQGMNIFIENAERTHHVDLGKIPVSELEIGDMLVGRLRGKYPNHCGIYIGGDDILHHPSGGASCTTNLQRWWPHIDTVLRHDGTQKPSPTWKPREGLRTGS